MSDAPPNDDQRPVTTAEIAAATGESEDEVLRRLAGILARRKERRGE